MEHSPKPSSGDPSSLGEFRDIWVRQREAVEKKRIQLEIFRGHKYCPDREIDDDLAFAERKEREYQEKDARAAPEQRRVNANARIIETLLPEVMSQYRWLGQDAEMIYTSRYDDYARGVDAVAQFVSPTETRHLGFEIDFASSAKEMADKILQIAEDLKGKKVHSVKYFDSPTTGRLKNLKMPKVAFGAPFNSIIDFFEPLAVSFKEPSNRKARILTEQHPLRFMMLRQIKAQLEQFRDIVAKTDNVAYAEAHQRALDTLNDIGTGTEGDIKKAA